MQYTKPIVVFIIPRNCSFRFFSPFFLSVASFVVSSSFVVLCGVVLTIAAIISIWKIFSVWKFVFLPTWLVFMHFALFRLFSHFPQNICVYFVLVCVFSVFSQLNFRISFSFCVEKKNELCVCNDFNNAYFVYLLYSGLVSLFFFRSIATHAFTMKTVVKLIIQSNFWRKAFRSL